jgi:hypothetical protein
MLKEGARVFRKYTIIALITSAAAFGFCQNAQAKPKFVTFMINSQPTQPASINAKGAITGTWQSGISQGFVRQPDGTMQTFSVPQGTRGTFPTSINKKGEITGYYEVVNRRGGTALGFLRKVDGTIKTFKIPNDNRGDFPVAVNSSGTIFGTVKYGANGVFGYGRAKNGTIVMLDCADGRTFVTAANDLNEATGACNDGAFVRDPDGTFTFFDAGALTNPVSINNEGSITGSIGTGDTLEGFVRTADGMTTVFAAGQGDPTVPSAINAVGVITGVFGDSGVDHGFIRAADGSITTIDPAGSTATHPTGINDKGVITGYYIDDLGQAAGFVRTP